VEGDKEEEGLEGMVGWWEEVLMKEVENKKGSRKWKTGKQRWWNEEVEEEYRRCREVEEGYFGRKEEEGKGVVKEARKRYKGVVERVKREHWVGYFEDLGLNKGYQRVKTDRNFEVDIPAIRGRDENMLEDDEGKG